MQFEDIRDNIIGVPFINVVNAKYIYNLILEHKLENILELGIAHGTATCYMAAALDELGKGKITSVDLLEAKDHYQPTPEDLLEQNGLSNYVDIIRTKTGYSWFLHDDIKNNTTNDICEPKYDLIIIDGPKNWTIDGLAFFLSDKLLKPNGWIIFDDYFWTYALADNKRDKTDGVAHRSLSEDEMNLPHVQEIFELLVKQHPNYSEFYLHPNEDWAIARKVNIEPREYTIRYIEKGQDFLQLLRQLVTRIVFMVSFKILK
ncbi:MAG: class I SAM-dependent methyltransferase [Balneola sp.]|jgi:predicted O-methyltransferase YrrM|uniref:class I SAM-dependent methyltransferase n=1 Tax=Balneola sp. EhC07 TaxID=1849360 RepID=UPI0007F4A8BD|nr:class I SAM-dependent methyltransferase [Balneola sp. EhC07]OAN60686.1 hypothetical protein A8B79_09190 [Balneola sp. EhC07]